MNQPTYPDCPPLEELASALKRDLFAWLKDRFGATANLWLTRSGKDPVKLRLFACDPETGWTCSLSCADVQSYEEWRPFRGEFIEKISAIESATGTA